MTKPALPEQQPLFDPSTVVVEGGVDQHYLDMAEVEGAALAAHKVTALRPKPAAASTPDKPEWRDIDLTTHDN